ncbi:EF-hand domain-containing protein [Thermomonas brevis]|uniref:EF-hand domain-containing protein n=1 Tax=Thermomonas brevis TaxID=215691 RepID=A0A7G9QRZ6_9GAMM|nr:EF-hand domain-containing protein [Thermomonas brevis]QNN46121.1 EF-hand domain-containing protein [Thermomonas brevis]
MKTGLLAGALACSIACALAFPALAQTAQQQRPLIGGMGDNVTNFIAQFDDNGDGKLDWAEFDGFRRTRFDATDSNHDGTVDVEEYVAEFAARSREAVAQERTSQLAQTRVRFDALDTDKDGRISRTEFDASGERVFTEGSKTLTALDDGSDTSLRARGGGMLGLPDSHTAEGFLALYDTNKDGLVSHEEFAARRDEQFARTDADKDGALSPDEYLAEFTARLDARIAERGKAPDTQTRVRFRSLDKDNDGKMTFAEYQVSGKRMFDAADRSHDGIVDATDATLPAAPVQHAGLQQQTPARKTKP